MRGSHSLKEVRKYECANETRKTVVYYLMVLQKASGFLPMNDTLASGIWISLIGYWQHDTAVVRWDVASWVLLSEDSYITMLF